MAKRSQPDPTRHAAAPQKSRIKRSGLASRVLGHVSAEANGLKRVAIPGRDNAPVPKVLIQSAAAVGGFVGMRERDARKAPIYCVTFPATKG